MRKLVTAAVAFAALAAAPAANAGCWATVKLSSLPNGSTTWNVNVRPLQHGRTPLPAAKPRIEIRREDATKWIVFRPKSKANGLFRFTVSFPGAGTYSLRVWDGFEPHCASYHTYQKVDIGLS
jgi:hypothetical protein